MSTFLHLLSGELQRMKKYHITTASLVATLIWVGVLHLITLQDLTGLFPLIIFIDATSMSMLLVGVTIYFEKQEGVLKTLLVSPISKVEYILAKSCANVIPNLVSLLILFGYAKLFKEVHVNLLALTGVVVIVTLLHSFIGLLLSYYSKDFTGMMMGMLVYTFIFMVPILLEQLGFIRHEAIQNLLFSTPTKASMTLLSASAGGVSGGEIAFSLLYLIAVTIAVYWFVLKRFIQFALKESGV